MKTTDLLQETYSALTSNKARSSLTVLGIVIGIGSVIAMIGLGQGAQADVESRIQSIGSNLLTVSPGSAGGAGFRGVSQGAGSAQTLTLEDSEAIAELNTLVASIAPEVSSRYQVTASGTNTNTSIVGTTAEYIDVRSTSIALGSFISDQNIRSRSKVAVLGSDTRDDLFGEGVDPIGQKVRINRIDFTVIGVMEVRGGTGFGSPDDLIIVPISTAQQFFTGNDSVSSIGVQVIDKESMSAAELEITSLLLTRHNIANPESADFRVFNQADLVETATSVTETFTLLLGAVAGISLLVGGIGIMNMMLTTVTERTREIGLRKSLGAKSKDISMQFLVEAVMLTFLGGIIGVIFGWGISQAISRFGGITTAIDLAPILLAFGVSAAIGIVFGYYPARRAAKLNPIDALRYE
jgi:putative ABC transport system permease protein